MSKLNVFARLVKVDEAKRQVTGVIANEAVDHSGEVFDYDSSKPNFVAWSETVQKASNGASVGNLRAQHGNVVAGKLSEMQMDDVAKSISVVADVVDDNEWNKVMKGCYTGFSIGGKYGAKWPDEALGKKRYTAVPNEVSLVDLSCNPEATFTVCKADGSSELRKYVAAPPEEQEDAVPSIVDELRKTLATARETYPEAEALHKHLGELINEADAQLKKDAPIVDEAKNQARLQAFGKTLAAKVAAGDAPTLSLLKAASGIVTENADVLAKGLYDASRICDLLCSLGYVTNNVAAEAMFEGDGSGVPAQLAGVMRSLGQALVALVSEEVAELMENYKGDAMATTVPAGDLKKVDENVTELVGEVDLAKSIGETLAKALAPIQQANETLLKSLETVARTVEEQGKKLEALQKNTPVEGGPRLRVVDKGSELRKDTQQEAREVTPVLGNDGKTDDPTTLIKQAHATGGVPLLKPRV